MTGMREYQIGRGEVKGNTEVDIEEREREICIDKVGSYCTASAGGERQ